MGEPGDAIFILSYQHSGARPGVFRQDHVPQLAAPGGVQAIEIILGCQPLICRLPRQHVHDRDRCRVGSELGWITGLRVPL